MAKQQLKRTNISPFIVTTLTAGTYAGSAISITGIPKKITGFPVIPTTSNFVISVVGTPGQLVSNTIGSTATIDLVTINSQTISNFTSLTIDPYGRISAFETAPAITLDSSILLPMSISINTSGFVTSFLNFSTITNLTFSSSTQAIMGATLEAVNTISGATGVVAHNFNLSNQWIHNSIAGNFTANFTNIPTTANNMINQVLILKQGSIPYMPTAVQINGVSQTIKWFAASVPSGIANRTEFITFSLCNINGSWIVLGSKASYA